MNTINENSTATRSTLWADVTEEQWEDWHWQIAHRIITIKQLEQVIHLSENEKENIARLLNSRRMAITPYYASLMEFLDPRCPIRMRAVPTMAETAIASEDLLDPLHEDLDSPLPGITHRYPDRALFLITDQCAM